jgi:hypothetical protein
MKRDAEFRNIPLDARPEIGTGWVSLIHELSVFPDVAPAYSHGGNEYRREWILPVYGTSTELEALDMLYALVRLLKPELIVEVGCSLGFGTYALGRAALDNGHGRVVTCDTMDTLCGVTRTRCGGRPDGKTVSLPVEVRWCNADDLAEVEICDFAWLDSGESEEDSYNTRIGALLRMKPGSIAAMHDTRNEPRLRRGILECGKEVVHLDSWRGLSLIQC